MNNVNLDKSVELVGGGSVINGVHPSSLEDSISEQTPPPHKMWIKILFFFYPVLRLLECVEKKTKSKLRCISGVS